MSNLAIQRATDSVAFDGHNLVNEGALDIQGVDFHRGPVRIWRYLRQIPDRPEIHGCRF